MTELLPIIALAAGCFTIAGTIKGVAGIGLPTASIALLTLFLDPRVAIAIVLFPMLGANAWQMIRSGDLAGVVRRYWVFALVLLISVAITSYATADVPDRALLALLGIFILAYVLASVLDRVPPLPDRLDRAGQLIFGLFAGIIGGMTAAWAAPMAIYLSARQVDKDEFVRATGFMITAGSIPLVFSYAGLGFLTRDLALLSLGMLMPTIAGFTFGEYIRKGLSQKAFRAVASVVFAGLALNLLRRAWLG